MRVAWFGHAAGRRADGLSSYSRQIVQCLLQRGVEVAFFSHAIDGTVTPSPWSLQLRAWRFKTVTIPLPRTRARILRALRQFQPDVMHLSVSFSLLDPWLVRDARRIGVPVVLSVHLPYAPLRTFRGRILLALYRFHRYALRAADRCLALSDDQRDLLISVGCDARRIQVFANGVDTDVFAPGPSQQRSRLGASFVVAYVGRLDPEKRVAALVRAFVRQRWPDDHVLIIAGSGSQERRIRCLATRHRNVRLLGAVHDQTMCVDILRAADVFVLPSTAEGLSLSLLEAMAAGCAVIATDAAESGIALGDAGIRLPLRPLAPALSGALRRLHDDVELRDVLGRRARARVTRLYSLRTRADDLLQIYRDLCDGVAQVA